MSIEEVKDIKKLQRWLKSALDELKYIKECCRNAGKELEKNSFAWDSKEKNLVIQAIELNKKFEASQARVKELKKENEELKAQLDTYVSLMNVYKAISKGREDNKTVTDYISKLEYKLTQFDINNKCGNSEYFTYTDNGIKDDILINLHTKN